MSKITTKQVAVNEFLNEDIGENVAYEIIREPFSLKRKINDILERLKLDEYSRECRRDYRNGITKDLKYKNTLDKCSNDIPIKMIWVEGYSHLMEHKHKDDINENVMYKVKKLLNDNKVGYITDDSYGCYLYCKSEDYLTLCKYLNVEQDNDLDNKECYYNYIFEDMLLGVMECAAIDGDIDKKVYDVIRYIIVNLNRYADILLNARPYNRNKRDEYWVNKLWYKANKDYSNKLNTNTM